MSIFDQIFGNKKKKEEEKAKQEAAAKQAAEDVAKARREELARRKQEAEDARLRGEESERKRLEALAKAKEQAAAPATPVTTGPTPSGIPGVVAATMAQPNYYIVQDDDYLSKIAKKVYGDAHRWPEIYEANKELIGSNPNIIHAGQKLRIP